MAFNLWSIILIASASQCVFLGVLFMLRPPANRQALTLLLGLLAVILAISINNIWYAAYLYRSIPSVAGFAIGLPFLLGPLLYLYVNSITRVGFRLRWVHFLHALPYLFPLSVLILQDKGSATQYIVMVDAFMEGEFPVTTLALIRFSGYVVHLLAYLLLTRWQLSRSAQQDEGRYLIPLSERTAWLNKLTGVFFVMLIIVSGLLVYMLVTDVYTVTGNFIITLAMSALVYMIAYQAILNNKALLPTFDAKYHNIQVSKQQEQKLLKQLIHLLEEEKIYTDPDLKIASLAARLNTPPHVLSKLINSKLHKTFFELINEYRIEAFKSYAKDPQFAHYSILGLANEVGYNSKSSFNTAFKKHTGLTPSEFMKSL